MYVRAFIHIKREKAQPIITPLHMHWRLHVTGASRGGRPSDRAPQSSTYWHCPVYA